MGLETAKNMVLAGPNKVTICDDNLLTLNDLGTNFYAKPDQAGKVTRADSVIGELKQLNSYVNVSVHKGAVTEDVVKGYSVVIFTDFYDQEVLLGMNKFCRENGIGFIYTGSLGLYGFCFVDFGDEHTIVDKNGENALHCLITGIS